MHDVYIHTYILLYTYCILSMNSTYIWYSYMYCIHCTKSSLAIIEEAKIFQDIQGKISVNTGKYISPLFGNY